MTTIAIYDINMDERYTARFDARTLSIATKKPIVSGARWRPNTCEELRQVPNQLGHRIAASTDFGRVAAPKMHGHREFWHLGPEASDS